MATPTEEVLSRLDALAAKLETTVKALWPPAVRHVTLTACLQLVGFLLIAGVLTWFVWYTVRFLRSCVDHTDRSMHMTKGEAAGYSLMMWLVAAIVIPLLLLGALMQIPDIIEPTGALVRGILGK